MLPCCASLRSGPLHLSGAQALETTSSRPALIIHSPTEVPGPNPTPIPAAPPPADPPAGGQSNPAHAVGHHRARLGVHLLLLPPYPLLRSRQAHVAPGARARCSGRVRGGQYRMVCVSTQGGRIGKIVGPWVFLAVVDHPLYNWYCRAGMAETKRPSG